jgi:hypothetical protein
MDDDQIIAQRISGKSVRVICWAMVQATPVALLSRLLVRN